MARPAGTDQDLLVMALVGYEAERAKIEEVIRAIQAQLGHRGPGRPKARQGPPRRALASHSGVSGPITLRFDSHGLRLALTANDAALLEAATTALPPLRATSGR